MGFLPMCGQVFEPCYFAISVYMLDPIFANLQLQENYKVIKLHPLISE